MVKKTQHVRTPNIRTVKKRRKRREQAPTMLGAIQDLHNDFAQANHQPADTTLRLGANRLHGANYQVHEQIHQAHSNQQVQRLLAQLQSAKPSEQANDDTSHAIERNAFWGDKLGWNTQSDKIVAYFQKLGLLPPLQSPSPEQFAEAVGNYQTGHANLGNDGIVGPSTWRSLERHINGGNSDSGSSKPTTDAGEQTNSKKLTKLERIMAQIYRDHGDFLQQKSSELGIDVADAAAFLKVESGGQGFSPQTDLVKIRFENHVFHRLWGNSNANEYREHFKFNAKKHWLGHKFRANPGDEFADVHSSQEREWEVLTFARALDEELALQSISMGSAQILGVNYVLAGYKSATEMFEDMSESIDAQNEGLFSYIQKKRKGIIITALQAKDYKTAARYYNGKGKEELYGNRLRAASDAYTRVVAHLATAE